LFYSQDVIDGINNPGKWNDSQVQDVLSKNSQAFALIDAALQKSKYQNPTYADPAHASLSSWMDPNQKIDPFTLLRMAKNVWLKSHLLLRQGKDNEALTESLKLVALGQQIAGFQPSLIEYLTGIAVMNTGLEASQQILTGMKLTPTDLLLQTSNLEKYKNTANGLVNVINNEYVFAYNTTTGNNVDSNTMTSIRFKSRYAFEPNKTKNIYADYYRTSINDVQGFCTTIINAKSHQPIKIEPSPLMMFQENSLGLILSNTMIRSIDFSAQMEKMCNSEVMISATQLMFAIKAYKIDTGKYPSSLTELAPKYIQTVPKDPYDGKSIKYDQQKKIVYSVGVNGTDQGGSTGDDWTKMPNPTFKINF
jgi:hypothetical protein